LIPVLERLLFGGLPRADLKLVKSVPIENPPMSGRSGKSDAPDAPEKD
jgi:hypothetical protein